MTSCCSLYHSPIPSTLKRHFTSTSKKGVDASMVARSTAPRRRSTRLFLPPDLQLSLSSPDHHLEEPSKKKSKPEKGSIDSTTPSTHRHSRLKYTPKMSSSAASNDAQQSVIQNEQLVCNADVMSRYVYPCFPVAIVSVSWINWLLY